MIRVRKHLKLPWSIQGLNTKTAGRLKQVQKYIGNEDFMLTYGDGVCDINLEELVHFIKSIIKLPPLPPFSWMPGLAAWM